MSEIEWDVEVWGGEPLGYHLIARAAREPHVCPHHAGQHRTPLEALSCGLGWLPSALAARWRS